MITLAELLAELAALVVRAPAAPPRSLRRRVRRPHRRCPVNTPESARPVRAAARACVCSLRVRTHAAAGHASAAHCSGVPAASGNPGCARGQPGGRGQPGARTLSDAGGVCPAKIEETHCIQKWK